MKLSKHFDKETEWMCKCGCEQCFVNRPLLAMAEKFREFVDKPVIVHCVNRCEKHNDNVGGARNSLHLKGIAMDCHVRDMSVRELHKIAQMLHTEDGLFWGGLGYYPSWGIHFDVGRFRTWGRRKIL